MIKLTEAAKIELIAFTAFLVIAFVFNVGTAINEHISIPNHVYFDRFWINLFSSYVITCVCYFLLVFYITAELKAKERQSAIGIIFFCLLIYLCLITSLINEYFVLLLAVKMMVVFINSNKSQEKLTTAQEALMLFSFCLFICAITSILNYDRVIRSIFAMIVPVATLHYLYAVHVLLPELEKTTKTGLKFTGRTILNGCVSYLPLAVLIFTICPRPEEYEFLYPLNIAAQFVIVPVVSWIVFKTRSKRDLEEIKSLKTELGKSDANLNFLKSQINPHFLFNALNTLYGTALQENAMRTSEGIQKLGDMMRFMLEDNLADKTLLATDIEYLKNYISLQKLRIVSSPNIHIETDIEESETPYLIAPMMLQPFVENAFKHGISLNNPSQIKITLQINEGKLYFDVSNSINKVTENDPERSKGGVGLQNVKQRLSLLYPDQHELIIRENSKEFFIHLTVDLTRID